MLVGPVFPGGCYRASHERPLAGRRSSNTWKVEHDDVHVPENGRVPHCLHFNRAVMSVDDVPAPPRLSLPVSLQIVSSAEETIVALSAAGLKPILLHAPTDEGGCTCGKVHDRSPTGGSSTGKHPIASNWQKHAYTIDELKDQIARLKFTPNIGIVLGDQPCGVYLVAIDVDDAQRFAKLETELGTLPETARCDSGRGYRLFYEMPHEIDLTRVVNVTGLGSEPGVDVKVRGGQVVVAPSLHASGKRYVWTRVGPVAPLPMQWAMMLLKEPEIPEWVEKYTPKSLNENKHVRTRAERWLEVAVLSESRSLAACKEGMRNTTLFRTACMLFEKCAGVFLGHKWQWIHDELLRAARVAGLAETEVRRTLASADKRVRESGKVRQPVWLADPEATRPPPAPGAPALGHEAHPPITEFAPPPPDDPWQLAPNSVRPVIKVSTELYYNVDESIKALRKDENVYQRDNSLVFVTRVSHEESELSPTVDTDDGKPHHQLVEGSPKICEMVIPTIRERLSAVAVYQKYVESTGRWKPILPTDPIVSAVHARKQWNGIVPLVGVIETPTMRPDGTVVQTAGYDAATGYVYLPSEKFPEVRDEHCTQELAKHYLNLLTNVFVDFPYAHIAHRAVPVAAILTLVARPAIGGSVPAFLFDASTRGSGKTLQTDAIAMVSTGRGAPRMNYTTDEIELEKILGGYALNGAPFICLDNVPAMRPFGGGPLDRVLTARDKVALRILGRTEVQMLTWRALIMATGNNLTIYGDTSRRSVMARLEPTEENPERRTKFLHNDLLAYIQGARARLVAAALLILRAYWLAKRPDMGCPRWGSFEEWSRLIPHAIVFAGGQDPMRARPECDEEVDQEFRSIRCVITRLRQLLGDDPFRISQVIDLLYKSQRTRNEHGDIVDDGYDDLRDSFEMIVGRKGKGRDSVPDSVELAKRLGAFRDRVIAGLRLTSDVGGGGILRWRIEVVRAPS